MFKFSKSAAPTVSDAIVEALTRSQSVIEFTPDGVIMTANANCLGVMGYALPELQGKHHRMLCDPGYADGAEYRKHWEMLARGQSCSGEFKRIAKGGRDVWIQAAYAPILDAKGDVFKIVEFSTDVTQAKSRIADAQGQFEAISKTQAVISFTPDGVILDANENFLNAMGYRLDEVKGQHHRMFAEADHARSADYARLWRSLRDGQCQSGVFKRVGKGGRTVWVQAAYNPILDPSGRVTKIVKFAADMTQARAFDAAIDGRLDGMVAAIASVTQQTGAAASSVSQATGSMQSVAAGAEELSASIHEISANVAATKASVGCAMAEIAAANANTAKLAAGAAAMNSIIDFIQDVASNINLLALNATIESARAGAAGKGFAVVASEVKNLANQVALATKKISSEISNIQSVSTGVVLALDSIGKGMRGVESSVTSVAGAIEEQTAVTNEISSNMQMTAGAVREIDQTLQTIRSAASEISDESHRLQADFKRARG